MEPSNQELLDQIRKLRQNADGILSEMAPMQERLTRRFMDRLRMEPLPYGQEPAPQRVDEDMLALSERLDQLSIDYLHLRDELDKLEKLIRNREG